jgi:hypothetical protein
MQSRRKTRAALRQASLIEGRFGLVRIGWRRVDFLQHFVAVELDEQGFLFRRRAVQRHVGNQPLACGGKVVYGLFEQHERSLFF